ncbi:protein-glutamate methylesterase/protein-glutamine glutaminase [Imhoffiella purpurea]|uniref:Protein-glutamate methylesterase/protein-glutamine glutaminase n=1 Tax=Imhoffiella purpurea TaxID=1249627 RepID=W9VBX0_9GAMM|nr:chemotaxis response regulator protein-glutamate methylesterase [Imhoffiella purpurea]EXJ13537.1 Chemotaxis response regulator protein-glutamate methylesterase CheB [Imhoffiella purpurea]
MSPVKVMVVDDSALVRQTLRDLLDADPDIEVVATAQDPYVAAEKLRKVVPDVITLDVEMPRMDGVTFLEKLMRQHPIPVVICSSLVGAGTETLMRALEAGAVDIIQKPAVGTRRFLEESRVLITDAVKAAAQARLRPGPAPRPPRKLSADAVLERPGTKAMAETTDKVIVIGASTGGTEAIREVLMAMPLGCPGIVIVQHMPEGFTRSFSERLDGLCRIRVKEAQNGDPVLRGQALIAPGNRHTLLKRSGARYYVEVKDGPLVSRHRPSVDVLFRSTARYAGRNAVAAVLTGMGDDGAEGLHELFEAGAWTCAQDEATSVVYGMPKEAVRHGGTQRQLPLERIAAAMLMAS